MTEQKQHPFIKRLQYRLEYFSVKIFATIANLLTVEQASTVAAFFGGLAFFILTSKRKTALENLAMAFPEKTPQERYLIARKSFQNAGISMTELFMIQKIVETARERFDLSETQNFDHAMKKNRGIVLASSHLGAWECHELLAYLKGIPIMVIVKNLKNPYVNHTINELRKKTLVTPYSKDTAIRGVFQFVKKNGIAAILIDQWAGPEGVWIPFFGKKTSTTTIAARFAQKTSAGLIPSFCIRMRPGKYKLITYPEILFENESRELEINATQKLNEILEEQIRKYPDQWIWGHRRWKEKPQQLRIQ